MISLFFCLKKPLSIIFILLFLPMPIQAASFDCAKAKSEVEKIICSNEELSKLDKSMNEAYLKSLNRTDIKEQAIQSQKEWLKYALDLCQNAQCIKQAYETRIWELGLMSSFGIVIFRDPNNKTTHLQKQSRAEEKQVQLGKPVQAVADAQISKNLLPLAFSPPYNARELAANAEIILVSGNEPANKDAAGSIVNVEINRPGSKVLLVLTSCFTVHWHVTASASTTISGIVTWEWGYSNTQEFPTITTLIPTQGFLVELPCVNKIESPRFESLLNKLNNIFGITKVDVARVSYAIPSAVRISELDTPSPELTLDGFPPQKPSKNFTFEVMTKDYKMAHWSLTGPIKNEDESNVEEGRVVVSKQNGLIFRLYFSQLQLFNKHENKSELVPVPPPNFPDFSHPSALAYDSKRDIVSLATLGGEGFLYRFDVKKKQWIDFRSLNNIDIFSLSYDESADRYVAWADRDRLLLISNDGNVLFTKNITKQLTGFYRLRGKINIAPNGNDIALYCVRENSIKNIWYYNLDTDTAILTYKKR
ncbi:MAG: DUF1311 domain-containing protein [Syntrophaceae bacterium]|nr:DUF1311 domain-containing protein [Syntrophaceae bacterium]